ncbi:MAG TPA: hypothetical protein VGE95_21555 [Arthrobacter sp.]
MPSHVHDRFYALSVAPLTALYYYQPSLAAAVMASIGTLTAVQEYRRRRKATPLLDSTRRR